jgi:hypothetical protein
MANNKAKAKMAELIKATKIGQKPIKYSIHRACMTDHEAAQAGKHKQIPPKVTVLQYGFSHYYKRSVLI